MRRTATLSTTTVLESQVAAGGSRPRTLGELAGACGACDLFVLRRVEHDRFLHLGGVGRGEGWAGIVELRVQDEPLAQRAFEAGQPVRVIGEPVAHVFGPYYASDAVLVPVGRDVLVVFGTPSGHLDATALPVGISRAALAEQLVDDISPAKRLADELEVLHAVKATMQVSATDLTDAAQHIAATAAERLSCELGILYLPNEDRVIVAGCLPRGAAQPGDLRPIMRAFADADAPLPACRNAAEADPLPSPLGPEDGVTSYYVLHIGDESVIRGVLMLCHTEAGPRGFTTLCQELGAKVAEAADTVLHSAQLRATLERQLGEIDRHAKRDSLTGLGNRRAFDLALHEAEERRRGTGEPASLIVVDLDGLKNANDTRGHEFGDTLLCRMAQLLRVVECDGCSIARLGGDEFALLAFGDETRGHEVADRIRDTIAAAETLDGFEVSAAVGAASTSEGGDVWDALRRADKNMYAEKLASGRGRTCCSGQLHD